MRGKAVGVFIVGAVFLVSAVGLTWFGFTTNDPNPTVSLSSLGLAVVLYGFGVYLISRAVRGLERVESTSLLRNLGTFVLVVGIVVTVYAAVAFFLINSLPPNDATGRLPSLYLLFAGMFVMLVGAVIRKFRLR